MTTATLDTSRLRRDLVSPLTNRLATAVSRLIGLNLASLHSVCAQANRCAATPACAGSWLVDAQGRWPGGAVGVSRAAIGR